MLKRNDNESDMNDFLGYEALNVQPLLRSTITAQASTLNAIKEAFNAFVSAPYKEEVL